MKKMNNMAVDLDHVRDWVFDVDNTLYPRTCDLFAQVDSLITDYMMNITGLGRDQARRLQKDYYRDHGTTLNGLMIHHNIDPDHYLDNVHNIDYSPVQPHPELVEAISALPGRKFIFTNADAGHARAVLAQLGAEDIFDGMHDIRATGYIPKPEETAYESFLKFHEISAENSIMFDDLEKNLKVPHFKGMTTVHVVAEENFAHDQVDDWELGRVDDAEHIHHVTDNLVAFLKSIK